VNIVLQLQVMTHPRLEICLAYLIALMMAGARTSETSANLYQTTDRNISEDIHLHTLRCEKLKFRLF
jgi:hypothetical protein